MEKGLFRLENVVTSVSNESKLAVDSGRRTQRGTGRRTKRRMNRRSFIERGDVVFSA